jgi:hypothetical protein
MSTVFNIILTICLMREKIDVSERFLNIYNRITDVHRLKTGRQTESPQKSSYHKMFGWTDTSALAQRLV